jgi:hypothetical protein
MRAETKLANDCKVIWGVQFRTRKYSAFVLTQISSNYRRPTRTRGGSRVVERAVGCGGRDSVGAQLVLRETNGVVADGEVVWSWRPDAGAKFFARRSSRERGTGEGTK